jgi:site-specific DNA recombinase
MVAAWYSVTPADAATRDRYHQDAKTSTRPRPEEEWIERHDAGLAIVDADTWDAAQAQLAKNGRYARRNNTRFQYLLRGLIRCPKCEGAYTDAADRGKRRYRCVRLDSTVSSTGQRCYSPSVLAEPLEDAVWGAVTDALQSKDILRSEFESRLTETAITDDIDRRLKHIEVAHKLVERKMERLADAYENEVMDLEMYSQRSDRHKARISALEAEASALREQQVTEQEIAQSTASFEDFLKQIDTGLAALTFDERQQFLRLLVEKITYEDGNAKVEVVFPPASGDESAYLRRKDPEPVEGRLSDIHPTTPHPSSCRRSR